MKKFLSAFLSAAIIAGASFPVLADDIPEKVEIQFTVGDSILSINGKDVKVQTPYVENGTTLVPLRVITEAFGSDVKWDGKEQAVTLDYPDVHIVLHIGSKTAQVNDHTEQLLEAPVVLGEGHTMVPLRFISETFGATVGWDQDTSRITVTKENAPEEDNTTVVDKVEYPKTGDSYYKWSINTPQTLIMEERSFDGTSTGFSDATGQSALLIDIDKLDEDEDITKLNNSLRSKFEGYTFIQSDMDKAANSITLRVRGEGKEIYVKEYIKDGKWYLVIALTSDDNPDKQSLIDLADSFSLSFSNLGDTYDLSNINESGYRVMKDEKYNVSFDVPADWTEIERAENEFIFLGKDKGTNSIHLSIYSAIISSSSNSTDAKALCESDREMSMKMYNPDAVTFSDIQNTRIGGIDGYYYERTFIEESPVSKNKDIFFDLGGYIYNFSVSTSDSNIMQHVIDSFSAEALDADTIGTMLRVDTDYDSTFTTDVGGYNFTIPSSWEIVGKSTVPPGVILHHKDMNVTMSILSDPNSSGSITSLANECIDYYKTNMGAKVHTPVKTKNINGTNYATFVLSIEDDDDGDVAYTTHYIAVKNSKMIDISIIESFDSLGGISAEDIDAVAGSIKAK